MATSETKTNSISTPETDTIDSTGQYTTTPKPDAIDSTGQYTTTPKTDAIDSTSQYTTTPETDAIDSSSKEPKPHGKRFNDYVQDWLNKNVFDEDGPTGGATKPNKKKEDKGGASTGTTVGPSDGKLTGGTAGANDENGQPSIENLKRIGLFGGTYYSKVIFVMQPKCKNAVKVNDVPENQESTCPLVQSRFGTCRKVTVRNERCQMVVYWLEECPKNLAFVSHNMERTIGCLENLGDEASFTIKFLSAEETKNPPCSFIETKLKIRYCLTDRVLTREQVISLREKLRQEEWYQSVPSATIEVVMQF